MLLFMNPENAFEAYRRGYITIDELESFMKDNATKYFETTERLVKATDEAKYWKEANAENYKLVLKKNEELRRKERIIEQLEKANAFLNRILRIVDRDYEVLKRAFDIKDVHFMSDELTVIHRKNDDTIHVWNEKEEES